MTGVTNGTTNGAAPDDVKTLAAIVYELAQKRTSHDPVDQAEFLQAIQKLQIAVEGPVHYLARLRHQPVEFISILLAINSGVAKFLTQNGGEPLSVQQLAEKAKADPLLITRFMRILTAINVFDEVGPGLYRENSISKRLQEPGQAAGFQLIEEWVLPIASKVTNLWADNHITQFPEKSKGEKSPFIWTHGMNQWDMMRGNNSQKLRFDAYMAARRNKMRPEWFNIYPASTELNVEGYGGRDQPPLVVDVGGNTGYDVARFLENNPHIKAQCVVEDLPETLAYGPKLPHGIEAVPYDFFNQAQPVKGARAYFFKAVCHDFDDADCIKFLKGTAEAMSPESSILIDDWVLPDVGAPLPGASEDMFMMLLLSGMERSESQWKKIVEASGLEIKKIWRTTGICEGVVEAKLKR